MYVAAVKTTGSFSASAPRMLFEGDFGRTRRGEAAYDVAPDGKSFVMVERQKSTTPTELIVLLEAIATLDRRLIPQQNVTPSVSSP
jgi:hypothetical protein